MVADAQQQALVLHLKALKATQTKAKAYHDLIVNQLKATMAGSNGLRSESFRISWKPSKERTTIDWVAVAADYAVRAKALGLSAEELAAVVDDHTTTKEGARPFRVTFDEEEGT